MAAGTLTSDHVNYLIWRYLQETGHGEAAVKLQRDWVLDPQTLPFADNVKPHALISLVQKGLQYHEIERSLKDSRSHLHASATALFFGTSAVRNALSPGRDDAEDATASSSRKPRRQDRGGPATNGLGLDLASQGPAPKRQRRNHAHEAATNGDAMQLDHNGIHDPAETASSVNPQDSSADDVAAANGMDVDEADPEGPSTPTPEPVRTLTNGQSTGMQSETSLDLPSQSVLTLSSPSQLVMHLAWNPQHPTLLAAAGEALCRIWQIPKPASPSEPYRDILPAVDESLASTMAWTPNGEVLAVATRNAQSSDWVGAVSLWTRDGKAIEELPATQEMVIMLRWNATGTRLLGITSSGERSSSVIVWDVSSSQTHAPCQIDGELRDAAWIDDVRFVVCGRGIVATSYYPSPTTVALDVHRDESISSKTWTHVRHEPSTGSTFCVAEDESLIARLGTQPANGEVTFRRDAHTDQITALELQPHSNTNPLSPRGTGRLLATTSLDGATKIWSTPTLNLLNVLSLSAITPSTCLNFTPDGRFLATANHNRILIWNPAEQGPPKAMWKGELGKSESGGTGNKKTALLANGNVLAAHNDHPAPDRDSAVGDVAEEDGAPSCSLSWDMEGRKLALGVNNQIAVVDFHP